MSEASEAKRSGHKLQRNSGRGEIAKGDALSDYFLVDYKEAEKSFTLNKKVWSKVVTDTIRVDPNRMPALKVILGTESRVRLAVVEWALVEEYEALRSHMEELQEEYNELKWRMDELEK